MDLPRQIWTSVSPVSNAKLVAYIADITIDIKVRVVASHTAVRLKCGSTLILMVYRSSGSGSEPTFDAYLYIISLANRYTVSHVWLIINDISYYQFIDLI